MTLKSENVTTTENAARIAQATAYVRSRFYPPLPHEYGPLAVDAVDLLNAGDTEAMIDVSHLPIQPRGTTEDGFVSAVRLVEVLRLEHMIEHDDEFDMD
jgi:hypothetical protein